MTVRKPIVLISGSLQELPAGDTLPDLTASSIHAATSKTTPVDADELGYLNSAAGFGLVKMTWANLRAWISSLGGAGVSNTPAGNISATNVQAAINELDSEKFDKSGGVISGNVSVASAIPAWGVAAISALGAKGSSVWSNATSGGVLHNAYFASGYSPVYTGAGYATHLGFNMSGAGGLSIFVAPSGAAGGAVTFVDALSVNSSGQVTINSGLPFGYGVGSGGTASQTTSKSEAVVLNKPNGQITMAATMINAGALVAFQCNNSLTSVNDLCNVNIVGGSAYYEAYNCWARCGASGIVVYVRNISAANLGENLVISFELSKGSAS